MNGIEMWDVLKTFFLSMVPIVELRGAIPLGAALGLPWYINYIICVIGNFLPVPFILLFIRSVLNFMKKVPKLDKIALWLEARAAKNSDKVNKYASLGLFVFVALPLPGTGAWTGALVAALMDLRLKWALPAIAIGVLIAGGMVLAMTMGIIAL